jgi:uncharacterized protein YbaP (TraB family)
MIRKIVCFVILSVSALHAQPHSSLLWKISGNSLKNPSYIYGTIHSYDRRAFTFDKLVTTYIKKCDEFGMEIKLDELNPFSLIGELTMPGDTTLKMLVADSDYKKFEQIVRDSFHIELSMFTQIKPMFLMGLMETNQSDSDYGDFLDEYLMKKAQSMGKQTIGIETVEEQLKAIDLVPLKEQAKMLVDELLRPDSTNLGLDDLLEVYKRGNLDSLYGYYKQGELSNDFNKALVTDRNHRMADRIDSIAKKNSIFVAVGALHLPGNEGVLNLLRKKGYQIEPIWKKSSIDR